MKLLLFSDLHSDFQTASKLVELSNDVDIVIGAGDFCIGRRGSIVRRPEPGQPGRQRNH